MDTIPLIAAMVIALHSTYPMATLQDVYKTCYQDRYGSGHMAFDSARAAAYLEYELEIAQQDSMFMPDIEPCGYLHRYERVSLANILKGKMSKEEVLRGFLASLPQGEREISIGWAEEWKMIEQVAIREVPEWKNDSLQTLLREAAQFDRAVHHSPEFSETYHPHYRIIESHKRERKQKE